MKHGIGHNRKNTQAYSKKVQKKENRDLLIANTQVDSMDRNELESKTAP